MAMAALIDLQHQFDFAKFHMAQAQAAWPSVCMDLDLKVPVSTATVHSAWCFLTRRYAACECGFLFFVHCTGMLPCAMRATKYNMQRPLALLVFLSGMSLHIALEYATAMQINPNAKCGT